MEIESCIPPGFRFHPTEEELVGYYLTKKINSLKIDLEVIVDIDLYGIEPWEIQEKCKMGYDEQREWYFFSHKDKKYPTGTRTNRATGAGFWKATGRDKAVLSSNRIIGMRKTLVFYRGRAPNGRKSDWIMHEYRLQTSEHAPPHEEGWVVCRAFKKATPNHRQGFEAWAHAHYLHNNTHRNKNNSIPSGATILPSHSFPDNSMLSPNLNQQNLQTECTSHGTDESMIGELPKLDSPTGFMKEDCICEEESSNNGGDYIDWKNMDDLIASQPISAMFYELDSQNQYGTETHARFNGWVPDF